MKRYRRFINFVGVSRRSKRERVNTQCRRARELRVYTKKQYVRRRSFRYFIVEYRNIVLLRRSSNITNCLENVFYRAMTLKIKLMVKLLIDIVCSNDGHKQTLDKTKLYD